MTSKLQRVLISLSLANICFLNMWIQLFTLGSPSFTYYTPLPPDWRFLAALVIDVLVLAVVIYLVLSATAAKSRMVRVIACFLFAALSLFALNELRHLSTDALAKRFPGISLHLTNAAIILAVLSLVVYLRGRTWATWNRMLLIISPLFFVLLVNLGWLYRAPVLHEMGRGTAKGFLQAPNRGATRVIWIIFDEMDQRLAFEARPARIHMPNFDRLLHTALHASKALAPGPETMISMPALICGREVMGIIRRPADSELKFAGSRTYVPWSSQFTIFKQIREAGYNGAISGWYNPYCRILGAQLSDCYWDGSGFWAPYIAEDYLRPRSIWSKAEYLADWQMRSAPFVVSRWSASEQPNEASYYRSHQILEYKNIVAAAERMLQNPNLDFVLVHVPIPHPLGIWNVATQSFDVTGRSNYLDNLELADRTLGRFRAILEKMGEWDKATVLASADHMFRVATWRYGIDHEMHQAIGKATLKYVPFILKLPYQHEELAYTREFNTRVSRGLLWNVLNGTITQPNAAAKWLDEHASDKGGDSL